MYRTDEELRFYWGSLCGEENGQTKVCCESLTDGSRNCLTPSRTQGKCIGIYDCPKLLKLLNSPRPHTTEIRTYLSKSYCLGSETYSVCCDEQMPSLTSRMSIPQPVDELPSREVCGKQSSDNRIVGGEVAAIDEYPWLAIIEYSGIKGRILTSCAGSLISNRYVLTAGHCVNGAVLTAVGTPLVFNHFNKILQLFTATNYSLLYIHT